MRIRQIVFAAQHLHASREALAVLFDLPPPFRDPGVAEFGIDNAVFTFGDQFIDSSDAPTTQVVGRANTRFRACPPPQSAPIAPSCCRA